MKLQMWLGGTVNDRYMSVKEPRIEAMSLKSRNETRDREKSEDWIYM